MRKVQLSSVYWGAYTKYQALLSTYYHSEYMYDKRKANYSVRLLVHSI